MKKCNKCGTVQNDSRTQCVDCGAVLGKPLSDAEEASINNSIDNKLENMAEYTEDFYVPLRDKIMGIISIIGIIASIVLLALIRAEKGRIEAEIPYISANNSVFAFEADNSWQYPSERIEQLDKADRSAFIALTALIVSCPMLLFPKFMYMLDTLKYRLFYSWDTTPSNFVLDMRKIITYAFFTVGVSTVLYGYYLYL